MNTHPIPGRDFLILRRSDLFTDARSWPVSEITCLQVGDRHRFIAADTVLMVGGKHQKLLKSRYGAPAEIKASYATRHNSTSQKVGEDGNLHTVFVADRYTDPGVLVCPPWTQGDTDESHPDDDILGVTVTRMGLDGEWTRFHDRGVFIPTPVTDEL